MINRYSFGGQEITLGLCDVIGEEGMDRLRPLSYPRTDVFCVCFSTARWDSFCSVRSKWVPEVRYHVPDVPIIFVGLQTDLREGESWREARVTWEMGQALARELGGVYVEGSVRDRGCGLDDLRDIVSLFC